ncbi:hypothetical protein EVAR_13669_1 [Eumeta japonica]|uniref:Uncharacterized protein n=1 Tax=Eumeta variegata TaxID=151549 RepID=A0A4C1UCQ9_EUMVA|nr:hypothetical protein EVAR_13669_1 [Eumeta japonica]
MLGDGQYVRRQKKIVMFDAGTIVTNRIKKIYHCDFLCCIRNSTGDTDCERIEHLTIREAWFECATADAPRGVLMRRAAPAAGPRPIAMRADRARRDAASKTDLSISRSI